MVSRKRLTRIVGVSVLTGATVLSQSGVAHASEATTTTTKSESKSSSSDYLQVLSDRYGTGDVNSFGSIVDVKHTSGDVNSFGSIAHISAEDCAEGNVSSFGSIVTIDEACVGKIDSFGSIVKVVKTKDVAPTVVKETEKQEVKEVKEVKEETKTEADVETTTVAECPPELAAKLVSYNYTINGIPGFDKLDGNVKPGDTVKVDFEIAEGCEDVEMSLVSYDAPSDTFTKENAMQQVLFDSATGKFDAGDHSMEVTLPECFFQVDFVFGAPIETFGPVDSSNYYADQGRLIDAEVAGAECVAEEPPPVVEEPPVEEPPVEVQPQVIEQQLAVTGTESSSLATLGGALLLMGLALDRASRRMRNNSAAGIA